MSTEAALMGAILTHPDEDTPRLVYADWLDEHAGLLAPRDPKEVRARAEFIRLQIAFDGREGDPEFDDARDRAWALQSRYGNAWKPPFPGKDARVSAHGGWWGWEFRGGFVEGVHNLAQFPALAEELFALAPVRALTGSLTSDAADALATCPHLRRIRGLDIGGGRVGTGARSALTADSLRGLLMSPQLAGLRELKLSWMGDLIEPAADALATSEALAGLDALDFGQDQFTEAVAEAIARSKVLRPRRLTAWGSACGDAGARLLSGSPVLSRVEVLRLSCGLTEAGVRALASSYLGAVWNLNLGGNSLGTTGAQALANSQHLADLKVLDLGVSRLPLDGLAALASSEHLRELKSLNLRWNSLRPRAGELIAGAPAFARLQTLNLNSNPIRDAGVEALARSVHLTQVRRIDLTGCKLTAAGAAALAEGSSLRALTHLALGNNRIEDAGAEALAAAQGFPNLRVLTLNNNFITDAGAIALAHSPQMETVEDLNLASNKITDVGAKALIESPHLKRVRHLRFKRNKVSRSVKTALAKRFESSDEE